MRCAEWSFSLGDRLTVVVLHGPSALRTVSESGGRWRGHSDIFLHYVADPESPASGGGMGGVAIGSAATTEGSGNGRARLGSHYTFQRLNDAATSKADATAELIAMQQPTCQRGSRSEVFASEERRRGLRPSTSFMRGFVSSFWQLLQR